MSIYDDVNDSSVCATWPTLMDTYQSMAGTMINPDMAGWTLRMLANVDVGWMWLLSECRRRVDDDDGWMWMVSG
jgi:hypothetical protein